MARPILLSNGELHVGINKFGLVHDFYYPYVGLENHAAAKSMRHKVGVWVNGETQWLDDGNWEFTFEYPYHALIGRTRARSASLGIMLEFEDTVDAYQNAFVRNVHIVNEWDKQREIRLFMHQVFAIGNSAGNGDTVQYLPDDNAMMHYKGHRVFIVSGQHSGDGKVFDDYAAGLFGIEEHDGTYRDAEDGWLSKNPVEHGRVDSVIGFHVSVDGHSSKRVHYWVTAGKTQQEALRIDRMIREEGVIHRLMITDTWWRRWLEPVTRYIDNIPETYRQEFIHNILLVKAHADKRGAIIASTDTTMLNYARDAYAYCWPRDSAYALWPLMRLGYRDEPLHFFSFCRRALSEGGYLVHKYQADGALGSSWHPYIHDDITAPPIQEDETAIVLFMFGHFHQIHQDKKTLHDYYDSFVRPTANFLAGYVDPHTGLPKPSYDIWEEVFLTSTYTTATVYAALLVAAELADEADDADSAVRWRSAATDIGDAAHKHLYNKERSCFYKGLLRHPDGTVEYDDTVDSSSVFGCFMFGLFPLESEELTSSIATLEAALYITDERPGVPRYEHDDYNRVDSYSIGNPWFITTLWMAQYYLETGNADKSQRYIDWVRRHMMQTGVLSEQAHPYTDEFMSVAPLAWSQAEYASTLLDMSDKQQSEEAHAHEHKEKRT